MSQMASKARRNKAVWDDNKDKIVIDCLLYQVSQGRRAGNSFKPQAWNEATTVLNNTFRPNVQIVTAADDVWEEYLKVHPAAKPFKENTLRFYAEMHQLFENTTAIGDKAVSTESGLSEHGTISIDSSSSDDDPDVDVIYAESKPPSGLMFSKTFTPQNQALSSQESPSPQSISSVEYQPHYKRQRKAQGSGIQKAPKADQPTQTTKEEGSQLLHRSGNSTQENQPLCILSPMDRAVGLLTRMVEAGTLAEDEFFVGVDILSKHPDQLSSFLYSNDLLRLR
ncbi:hypothetical protein B9Z19DRAFT_1138643 [Tuber borchii]|uniref:Myb/SANT-like domain-containing protein n=1 Tax=Tuber borchii TaxID=42251 RepID=A0A2T6Z9P4_TUBBO|nr:hypothetical protein B9Z19DRAFT_1138643 [Tuber borchii]